MTVGLLVFSSMILIAVAIESVLWWAVREQNKQSDLQSLWFSLMKLGRVRTWHIPKHAYPRVESIRREVVLAEFKERYFVHFIVLLLSLVGGCGVAACWS